MKFVAQAALLVAASFCASAIAAPAYLTCKIDGEDGSWNLAADEGLAQVGYYLTNSKIVNKYPAIFTADVVYFGGMEIDRHTLVFTRTVKIVNEVKVDKGNCVVVVPTGRKF